ncbi:MAG: MarR family transcriptional regulator [Rhodoglobus sp.]
MSSTPDEDLRFAILRLSRRMRLERVDGDVTDSQLSVLFGIVNNEGLTIGVLSDLERVTPPSMNRTVNGLVEAGLATRTGSPDDGRKVIVVATEQGKRLVLETRRKREAWFSTQLSSVTPDERAALDAASPILRRLADS